VRDRVVRAVLTGAGAAGRWLGVARRAGVGVETRPEALAVLDLAELVGGAVAAHRVDLLEGLLRAVEQRLLLGGEAGQRRAGAGGPAARAGVGRVDGRRLRDAHAGGARTGEVRDPAAVDVVQVDDRRVERAAGARRLDRP